MKNITLIIIIESLSQEKPISYALNTGSFPRSRHATDFKIIIKNSENGLINWIQVIKYNTVIMEIKESACAIFGCDEIKP